MKSPVKKMLVIMVLLLQFMLLFGSYGLYSWSITLDGELGYRLFYSPLNKWHQWTNKSGLSLAVEKGRDFFIPLTRERTIIETHMEKIESMGAEIQEREILEPVEIEILPEAPLYSGDTLDVLVLGDSLANSVGKQLGPLMNLYPDMNCRVEGVISSNLIRLDYYDWLNMAPPMAEESDADCVLIFLGANTMQSFYLDGNLASLFSDEWIEIYKKRGTNLLDGLEEGGRQIFWMKLPPMQKDQYNKNITFLDGIIDEICYSRDVERLTYRPLISNEEGEYISEKIVDDRQILLRSDGVHFTREGAQYISRNLISQLREKYGLPPMDEPVPEISKAE